MKRFPRLRMLAFTALFVAVACMVAEAQPPRGGQRREGGGQRGQRGEGGGQRGPGGGGFGMRGGGMVGGVAGLLRSEQVQEEIKVTAEQKTKLRAFAEEQGAQMRERMGQMFGGRDRENREELSDAERQAQREKMMKEFQERAKKAEESIRGMLEAKQFKRLKQIEMQQQGVNALMRPDIAQALGLTEEQQAKMKEVFEGIQKKRQEIGEQSRSLFQGFREASEDERAKLREKGEELRAKGEALQKESEQKAMGLLTADQKEKLKGLMGERFELDRRRMSGRPGGGRQGGGDRGQGRPGGGNRGEGGGNRRPQGGDRPARPQA